MRIIKTFLASLFLLVILAGCGEEFELTLLFTGDDHGHVTPAG